MQLARLRQFAERYRLWLELGAGIGLTIAFACWRPILGVEAALVLVIHSAFEIDRLRRRVRDLEGRDALTGAASRAAFIRALELAAGEARACDGSITIAVLDCDSFKAVNDSFGHCVGDEVLRCAANVLMQQTAARGAVARLWGDAFAVVLRSVSFGDAHKVLEQVQDSLRALMTQRDWPVTFSIGAVTFDRAPTDLKELLPAADSIMYTVKRGGRNGLRHVRVAGGHAASVDWSSTDSPPSRMADEPALTGTLPARA
jgi:diguanylate cyclase (GGDEF)-like protein